ncbi:ribose-phosphate pyrophosphokinase [Candidatus Saccharibacteria bacterium]|nr:ribose-phosphate pyrophosphokinase [Candidatus Saccharibacteria bacterium]
MAESYLVLKGSPKKVPVMFSSFPDGDIHAIVENIADCKNQSVLLFHRLYPNQNSRLIQLFLTLDVLKEHGAKDISVFVPYLPYSRQDKRYIPGEAISADALCRMLKGAGCTDLYTLDCHFMKGNPEEKRGGLKVHNISVGNSLVKAYKKSIGTDKFDVVGPDSGSSYLTVDHGGKNMHKTRGDYKDLTLSDSYRDIESLIDDHIEHTHDNVLIIDDMISTGSTIIKATERLRAKGIKNIAVATTHAFFLRGSYSTLDHSLDQILYSDSIEQPNAVVKCEEIFDKQIVPEWRGRK